MTVDQVKAAAVALEAQITQLVQQFETQTGCLVHSVPIIPANGSQPATARVKVQIGQ